MPLFRAALAGGATYLDMAMSLSVPHPEAPHERTGVMLGDEQFALEAAWREAGQLALLGMGVEPGLSDVFARYAADHLFSRIDELGVRDGADLRVEGHEFAPPFSIWTLIEECLNPPVVWERGRGWFTTPPFSEPEVFDFPAGIGPLECVNVEHEEVLLMPRWVDVRERVTFKYGLGDKMISTLRTLHELGSRRPSRCGSATRAVSPREVVAACLPDPATLGAAMTGKTCAGLWVRGLGTGRRAAAGLPPPRGRQRLVDARVRLPGGGVADGDQPGRGAGADRGGHLVGGGGARSGGVRRRAVPGPADRVRVAVGAARGRLTARS